MWNSNTFVTDLLSAILGGWFHSLLAGQKYSCSALGNKIIMMGWKLKQAVSCAFYLQEKSNCNNQ